MAYQFVAEQSLTGNLRRIVQEELEHIHQQLALGEDTHIHEARKSFKKLRAVIMLARFSLSDKRRRFYNEQARDLARTLAPLRDSYVQLATLQSLKSEINPRTYSALHKRLQAAYDAAREQSQGQMGDHLESVRQGLSVFDRLVQKLEIEEDFSTLHRGLRRTYRNAQNLMHASAASQQPDTFHDWRKQTKYLWHQVRMMEPLWPDLLGVMARHLKNLSDMLGEAHDLYILHRAVALYGEELRLESVLELVQSRQQQLEQSALELGRLVFAESPDAFADRMRHYWQLWNRPVTPAAE